jgi:hypothetical protein
MVKCEQIIGSQAAGLIAKLELEKTVVNNQFLNAAEIGSPKRLSISPTRLFSTA